MGNYTLQQAQTDIAALRGQIAHLLVNAALGNVAVNGTIGEAWTGITVDAGWTIPSSAGYAVPRYRLIASNLLQLSGTAIAGAVNGTLNLNNSNPLPAACRPASSIDFYTSDTIGTRCHMSISTGGVITAHWNSAVGSMVAEINAVIPLD